MQKPSRSNGKQIADGNPTSVGEFTAFADLIDNTNKRSDVVKGRQDVIVESIATLPHMAY